jgi:NADH-quinone oxidoreductase subunit F
LDIHVGKKQATAEERAAVDAVLGEPRGRWDGGGREREIDGHLAELGSESRARRHLLLPALHAVNDRTGWISEGALNYICVRLSVPPAEAYGVASFYHMFSLEPRAETVVYACDDIACACNGAEAVCAELEQQFGPEHSTRGGVTWERSPCLGLCNVAPAALVVRAGEGHAHSPVGAATIDAIREAQAGSWNHWAFRSSQRPEDLTLLALDGERTPAADALAQALRLGRERVVQEVVESKLLGRGGAAFPTGRKWQAVAAESERPHYVVCNADESEPGTFKDLALMVLRPASLVDAITIAGFACGCEKGYVYVRGEYTWAALFLQAAIHRARADGRLGDDVLGSRFAFDIEVRRGAGAYICGEETALFNSIEGYRGEPRNKPPFPTQRGLFGKPTVENNVETLANIPRIVLEGGKAFAAVGTAESTGTKLFCVSGHVEKPGVYEAAFGITLRQLVDMAGGVRDGKSLQAVLLGGAAGTFLTPDEIDVPLTFEGARAAGASLGSGVVMLFDETVDLRNVLGRIARFFRDESCGQCVPCRVGTQRQVELLARLGAGSSSGPLGAQRVLLADIGRAMRDASICGLGQTASSAIESALAKFPVYGAGGAR